MRDEDDENMNDRSFEELSEKNEREDHEDYGAFNIKGYLGLQRVLKRVLFHLENRKNDIDMINTVRGYIDYVLTEPDLDDLAAFNISSLHKKAIRNAFLNERLTMLILTFIEASKNFEFGRKYLHNMVVYSLENYYLSGLLLTKGKDKEFNELIRA